MIKCNNCGWIGEHKDLTRVEESIGEFWGIPVTETMYYCPCCGRDYLDDEEKKDKEY